MELFRSVNVFTYHIITREYVMTIVHLGASIMMLYPVSPVRWDTYILGNRVENQKLNQMTAELPFG